METMTTTTNNLINGVLLTDVVAIYYTATLKTTISAFSVTNSTASAKNLTLYLVPLGGSPSPANMLTNAKTIGTNATFNVTAMIGQTLEVGTTIQGLCDVTNALNIIASGYEQTA
jgi:hypothetical protein